MGDIQNDMGTVFFLYLTIHNTNDSEHIIYG